MRTLARRLLDSSNRFLDAALRSAVESDAADDHLVLLHAATAIEHLAKARLAEINPLLLLDGKADPLVLLWLADESRHDEPIPPTLRTIGFERAVEVVGHRVALQPHRSTLDELRRHRNGIAHVGQSDKDAVGRLLPGILAVVRAMADGLLPEPEMIFGDYRDFARAHLATYDEKEEREYAVRVEQARARFNGRYPDVVPAVLTVLSDLIEVERRRGRQTLDEQVALCPVCGVAAHLDGELRVSIEVDFEYDDGVVSPHAYPVGEYRALSLTCPTCGLCLDSPSMIERSGALENWHLSAADLDEAVADHQDALQAEHERDWAAYLAAGGDGGPYPDDEDEDD